MVNRVIKYLKLSLKILLKIKRWRHGYLVVFATFKKEYVSQIALYNWHCNPLVMSSNLVYYSVYYPHLASSLSNREERVMLAGTDWLLVSSGVSQGSSLGPLCFIPFMDDLAENILSGSRVLTYADLSRLCLKLDLYTKILSVLKNDVNCGSCKLIPVELLLRIIDERWVFLILCVLKLLHGYLNTKTWL